MWDQLISFDFTLIHFNSFEFMWFHLNSHYVIWVQLISFDFIWFHFSSFGFTRFHLISCDFIWFHMNSLDFIWINFFIVLTREKGTYACTRGKGKAGAIKGKRERPAGHKGKGKEHVRRFGWNLTRPSTARTHVRTHGTTRNDFPVTGGPAGLTPQPPICHNAFRHAGRVWCHVGFLRF